MLIPIDRIVSMLTDRCEALVRELLPGGHRDGPEWREASTAKGGRGDSLSVHLVGSRRGVWFHGAADESGDLLDLVAYLKFGGDKGNAVLWCKRWLGLDGDAGKKIAEAPKPLPRKVSAEDALEQERRRCSAQAIYLASAPIEGTPVETYLRGRDLDVRRLGFPLHALRYHPELWDRYSNRKWPAMVAAITRLDGQFLAVHRTFLHAVRPGVVEKAPIVDADGKPQSKRTFGAYRGGTIRLWRGIRVDPDTGEIKQARRLSQCKAGVWIDLTEGIEDGLTVALADQEARVLCAVSVANFSNIRLPDCVEGVVLWRQNDAAGSPADRKMDRVVEHFRKLGKRVAEVRPPEGIKDANDYLRDANSVRARSYALDV